MKTKNKGITLIVLVITIVILLILAGISISILSGSRIFEKAQIAKEKSENAQIKENKTLDEYQEKIGEYIEDEKHISGTRAEMGKLLWEGEWTSGSITVNGISEYTMCIAMAKDRRDWNIQCFKWSNKCFNRIL